MAKKGSDSTHSTTAGATVTEAGVLLQLDPNIILADDNTRFNLKPARIESLAQSIIDRGGVMEPVEVEPYSGDNGFKYRLTTGFYRLAAVKQVNVTAGAGLMIPAIVQTPATPQERLRRQIAENMERENQSPMDKAIAIRKLQETGLDKMAIRTIFSMPGGRKGNKVQIASNSFVNMHLSFLDLPKTVQEKIHSGVIGTAAAYELTRVDPGKRQDVIDRAEAARQKEIEREEREDERLAKEESKAKDLREEREKAKLELDSLEKAAVAAKEAAALKEKASDAAYEATKIKHPDAKSKKAAEVAFKGAKNAWTVALADERKAQDTYESMRKRYEAAEVKAAEKAQAVKQAKVAAPAGNAKQDKAVGATDIKKAAAAEGASTGAVALKIHEVRKVVSQLTLPGGDATVQSIGKALVSCFAGESTPEQLYKELVRIVS